MRVRHSHRVREPRRCGLVMVAAPCPGGPAPGPPWGGPEGPPAVKARHHWSSPASAQHPNTREQAPPTRSHTHAPSLSPCVCAHANAGERICAPVFECVRVLCASVYTCHMCACKDTCVHASTHVHMCLPQSSAPGHEQRCVHTHVGRCVCTGVGGVCGLQLSVRGCVGTGVCACASRAQASTSSGSAALRAHGGPSRGGAWQPAGPRAPGRTQQPVLWSGPIKSLKEKNHVITLKYRK